MVSQMALQTARLNKRNGALPSFLTRGISVVAIAAVRIVPSPCHTVARQRRFIRAVVVRRRIKLTFDFKPLHLLYQSSVDIHSPFLTFLYRARSPSVFLSPPYTKSPAFAGLFLTPQFFSIASIEFSPFRCASI